MGTLRVNTRVKVAVKDIEDGIWQALLDAHGLCVEGDLISIRVPWKARKYGGATLDRKHVILTYRRKD